MAEDPEKRFERAMGRLFSTTKSSSSPPAPAASSAGASTPSRVASITSADRREIWEQTRAGTPLSNPSSRPPRAAVSTSTPGHGSLQPSCRPWDRRDLLRRLATFKSITWFGKPQVAGPVACARRGWVNVDIDLLACEGCGARLSFPVPPSWTRVQVDSAAEAFGEQLESAHKALCAWKGNGCAESLALFPPTPLPALVEGYSDRCEALLQLSALPVISSTAVDFLKVTRRPQVENILAQPPPLPSGFPYENERNVSGAGSGEKSETGSSYSNFYQAQRLIALCGWEPRVLPYTVDCEERTAPSSTGRTFRSVGSSDELKPRKFRDHGPSVLLVSRSEKVVEKQDSVGNKTSPEKKCDPASAVLDCSLCGASVGLWGFSTIRRPSAVMGSGLADMAATPKSFPNTPMCGASAASGIHGGSGRRHRGKETAEQHEEDGEATTTPVRVWPSPRGVLDLSLTIAGGPPPTQLSSPAMIPPTFGPIPGFHPRFAQAEASEMGDWVASYESRGPQAGDHGAHRGGSTAETSSGRPLPADSVDGTVVDHDLDDGEVGKGADSFKRKRRTDSSAVDQLSQGAAVTSGAVNANVEVEPEVQGTFRKRNKRGQGALTRQDPRDFPRSSSVNAIDTYYNQKQENSMESVENHREDSDGHETAASGDNHDLVDQVEGTETVVQAQQSGCREAGSGRSVQPLEPDLSKSDEVGCDEGAETNVAVISTGTGTGGGASVGMGGGSVGMEGSHEAELQGEVNGADFSVHRTHSVAGEAEFVTDVNENQGLMGEFIPDRGLMGESVAEDAGKADLRDARVDSHEVILAIRPGKRRSKNKVPAEGESGESRGKRICVDDRDQTDDEGTVDTTKAVIVYGDSAVEKEATVGHTAAVTADEDNDGCTTVNGPGRGLDELRIWEMDTGEFDPIRQHRHFCPWVNVHVGAAASSSSSAVCGWQLTVDAVHASLSGGLAETESTASIHKICVDPLVSVRKLLGTSPSKVSPPKQHMSHLGT